MSIRIVVNDACSYAKSVNARVPQGYVLFPTLFLLHVSDVLHISNIRINADEYEDALYTGRASVSQYVDKCLNKLKYST